MRIRHIPLFGIVGTLLTAVVVSTHPTVALGDTGCATASAPSLVSGVYEIDSAAKLQWVKDSGSMSASYKLTASINMAGCTWTRGIGTSGVPFTGNFDGSGRTISNLSVVGSASASGLGLVGYLSGSISNITLASPTVTGGTGNDYGGLVGKVNASGSVSDATLTSVSVSGGQQTGGALGSTVAGSTVSNVSVSGTVSAPSGVGGGVVGTSQGSLTGLTSSATVTGDFNLGGLVGSLNNSGTLTDSTSTGSVSGTSSTGGAVGSAAGTSPTCGTLTRVTVSGNVSGSLYVGGLLGYGNCYYVYQSSSSAVVTASSSGAGGLLGYDNIAGRIEKSYFTGSVTGTEQVGGIAGATRSLVTDSYSSGSVTATSATNGGRAGGLVGWMLSGSVVTRSIARGPVTPPAGGSSTVGGLVGQYSSGTINSGLWDIDATGRTTSQGTGAKGFTSQQLKDHVLFDADNLNWDITDGISSGNGITTGTVWSVCSGTNSGYPFLTHQGLSGTCRPTMAYNGNGNTGGAAPTDASTPYASGDTVTVVGNTGSLTKSANVFTSWNTKVDGTGVTYSASDTFIITRPVMLFAQWSTTPQVVYSANGGSGSIANTSGSSGSSVTLSGGSGFSRTGYVLSRWDTTSAGTGTPYSKSQSITMPPGGLALYAVWTSTVTSTNTSTTVLAVSGNSGGGVGSPVVTTVPGATTLPATATTMKSGTSSSATTAPPAGVATTTSTTTIAPDEAVSGADGGDVPDIDGVGPGQAGATVNGAPEAATIEVSGGSLVVRVGGLIIRYTVTSPDGLPRAVSGVSAVQLFPGDSIQADFEGFGNDSTAEAWLVPGDSLIGGATLKNGRGTVRGIVPEDSPSGGHRIVTRAETPMGEPVVVAYGVMVIKNGEGSVVWSRYLVVLLGIAILFGLLIPAARRRRREE